ncbi:signal recognition particle protein [Microbacterium mcarthurae (nom. nud.)]|uniref:signal-recognition-particle GTPase n=1 Tax=Microbacterium mcarthurae TaxID=3035918 RepID=A0ABW9GC73_9MICO
MAAFSSLSDRLTATFKNLRTKGKLTPADVDGTVREIRRALLDADVALEVVKEFTGAVRERALSDEVNKALNPAQQVVQIVNEELIGILGGQQRRLDFAKKPPTVIMLAGLQGAGKTTLAGKLAKWLKKEGHTPLLVASDLQRPNAVTQLQVVGEQAGVPVFAPEPGNGVGNPVKVAKDGVKEAERKQYDTVIVDTAGRLGIDAELMKQASDIRTAVDPDEVLFVIDAMIGQDAVTTARAFLDGVDFTGVVLSKLDGDARGGAALSVASVTGRPIMFASTGEGLDDFEPFHPDRMASRILDLGDILTLIEQAQAAFDEEEAAKVAEKFATDSFTLDDFLKQMQQLRNMGSIKGMLGMLPGARGHVVADGGLAQPELLGEPAHHRPSAVGVADQLDDPRASGVGEHRQRGSLHHRIHRPQSILGSGLEPDKAAVRCRCGWSGARSARCRAIGRRAGRAGSGRSVRGGRRRGSRPGRAAAGWRCSPGRCWTGSSSSRRPRPRR